MTDVAPDWSDDRIAAAFRDRAAERPTPAGLVPATMTRISSARPERRPSRLAWAGALATVVAIAVIAGSSLIANRPSTPTATDTAASSGRSTEPPPGAPTASPTGQISILEFAVGPRRMVVEVDDRSGRLIEARAAPGSQVPFPQLRTTEASQVDGRADQIRVDWIGGPCDSPVRLTIGADLTSIRASPTTPGLTTGCRVARGFERGVVLTFDGPVRAADLAIVGALTEDYAIPTALGLTVMTVEEALSKRTEDLDDTELAVSGFWYRQDVNAVRLSCPSTRAASPILLNCTDRGVWLTALPESDSMLPPSSPAIEPVLRNAVSMDDDGAGTGEPVLLIGHFDDHRAAICTGDIVSACRGSFVVDLVLDPSDPIVDLDRIERRFSNTQSQLDLEATVEEAELVATGAPRSATSGAQIVAAFAVAGPDLRNHEPHVTAMPELTEARAVWVIRYLGHDAGRPVVRTKLVIDGSPETLGDRVYEVTASGVAPSVGY